MIQIYRFFAIIGTHAHKVIFVAYDVNQLKLFEKGSDRIKAFAHFRPRLDGDAERRSIVEDETEERVRNRPFAPVGDEKIEAGHVRQLYVALFIVGREIIQAPVFEISYAGNMYVVAIDGRPWHHRDFRAPRPIVRGRNK